MLYILVVVFPPVAVAIASRSVVDTIASVVMTVLFLWVGGIIHAMVLVAQANVRRRARATSTSDNPATYQSPVTFAQLRSELITPGSYKTPSWLGQIPGFRSQTGIKTVIAVICYVALFLLLILGPFGGKLMALSAMAAILLLANVWSLRQRLPGFSSSDVRLNIAGWSVLLAIGALGWATWQPELDALEQTRRADAAAQTESRMRSAAATTTARATATETAAETRRVAAAATAQSQEVQQIKANDHLAAATQYAEDGELGLALVELDQAVALAPRQRELLDMQRNLRTRATQVVREAIAQETAVIREARAIQTLERAAAATATAQPRIGTVVRRDNWEYIVTRASRPGNRIQLDPFSYAQAAGQFVLVELTLTNLQNRTDYRAAGDFQLTNAVGDKIPVKTYLGLRLWFLRTLHAEEITESLPPRTPEKKALLFDAPRDAAGFKLIITPACFAGCGGPLSIELGL